MQESISIRSSFTIDKARMLVCPFLPNAHRILPILHVTRARKGTATPQVRLSGHGHCAALRSRTAFAVTAPFFPPKWPMT